MLFENYPELLPIRKDIEKAIDIVVDCYRNGGKLLLAGNGGSASDSAHIVGELMKGFTSRRPVTDEIRKKLSDAYEDGNWMADHLQQAIPAVDLTTSNAILTAFANDVSPEMMFAQLVLGYGLKSPNDVFIGLSTSGNSKNVVNAVKTAKAIGLRTIAFTGEKDSACSALADVTLRAPSHETYRVQEYHLPIYHYICMKAEEIIFGK